jgi:hypothetical protein
MIFVGQVSLRRAIADYMTHYHRERSHQGLNNKLIQRNPNVAATDGVVHRRARIGGMLNFYYRTAA